MKTRQPLLVSAINASTHVQLSIDCFPATFCIGLDGELSCATDVEGNGGQRFEVSSIAPSGAIRIANTGNSAFEAASVLVLPGECFDLSSGETLRLQSTLIAFVWAPSTSWGDTELRAIGRPESERIASDREDLAPSSSTLELWFNALGGIQRKASCSPEFYQAAVEAIVDPGGLDAGIMLDRVEDGWRIRCSHAPNPPAGLVFDPAIVDRACRERQTVYHANDLANHQTPDTTAAFAAPVFDAGQNVVGVIYGSRRRGDTNRRQGIRHLEARWIQLLAEAVSTGVARREQEVSVARKRVLLEQAFPPSIVSQLASSSEPYLVAEQREVTVMFADLINSSGMSERLTADETHQMLADVLDAMTIAVQRLDGTIVDYYGDGMIAMWNAPLDQPDHAKRACTAGLELLRLRDGIDQQWSRRVGQRVKFGVGIHSGRAMVGNSGSRLRLKYGPRGFVVNLANRVERATRTLRTPIVISDATWQQVASDVCGHRLGQFRLWSIEEPIVLYRLCGIGTATNATDHHEYEQTLRLLERGDFEGALHQLDAQSCSVKDDYCLSFLRRQLEENEALAKFSPCQNLVFDLTAETV